MRIATVGNTIQTVNSPMYDTYMSTPGNTAKPRAIHSNIQTGQRSPSMVGSEPTMHKSAHHWVSTLTHYVSQAWNKQDALYMQHTWYTSARRVLTTQCTASCLSHGLSGRCCVSLALLVTACSTDASSVLFAYSFYHHTQLQLSAERHGYTPSLVLAWWTLTQIIESTTDGAMLRAHTRANNCLFSAPKWLKWLKSVMSQYSKITTRSFSMVTKENTLRVNCTSLLDLLTDGTLIYNAYRFKFTQIEYSRYKSIYFK